MKAIIIENEYEVDGYIKCFLKDNPNLFESVQEELYCLHRGKEELLPHILKNDAIIVASTWMYKDQLEEFLDGFLHPNFPVKKIFVHWITRKLNEWKHGWTDEQELFKKVKEVVKKGFIIYEFTEDQDSNERIEDGLDRQFADMKIFPRGKYTYYRLKYSEKYDLFYYSHPYGNLETQIEDEQDTLKRKNR